MASCVSFDNDGVLRQTLQSTDECEGYILISPLEHRLTFESVDITPGMAISVFSIAFSAIFALCATAYKVNFAKKLVRNI
ncbi:MAG: hypothetical protein COB45_08425 [Gammaproteobacteria bacterium]|nr:MAG: hypothetical protein COB45_08425 [Gammaproteobacteria bacterium]